MSNTQDEKRRAVRLPFHAPLILTIKDTAAEVSGICSNMSGTGILVTLDVPLATDIEVNLHLKDNPEAFKASGRVVRLVEDNNKFMAAIRFDNIG